MNLEHFRVRDRLGLLAASALSEAEAEGARRHIASCAACREEFEALTGVAEALAADARALAPLPIDSGALRARVFARIREEESRKTRASWSWMPAMGALSLVLAGTLAGLLLLRLQTRSAPGGPEVASLTPPPFEATAESAPNDALFYEKLEKTHVRASAARYLAEAQDVLVQVTAAADCPDSPKDSVDVTREATTSRRLLSKRATLVADSGDALLAARGVIEEVEGVLQEVAELPQCTRRSQVNAIARRVDTRRLLMKIDLVSQELVTP